MSFGRFPRFDDDPFFSSRDPFTMGFPSFPPMLGFPHQRGHSLHEQQQNHRRPHGQTALANLFQPMFGGMEQMMNASRGNNSHFYSSSSVMHFSNTGGGNQPQVYHATSSVTSGPGGVKETRKTECDSQSGMKKMAIGHHIGDRSHTVEKRENVRTKDRERHQQFVNLDESDASNFDSEWQKKTSSSRHQHGLQSHDSERLASRRGIAGHGHREYRSRSPETRHQVPPPVPPPPAATTQLPSYSQSEANRRSYSQSEANRRSYAQPEADRRREYLRGRSKGDKKVKF